MSIILITPESPDAQTLGITEIRDLIRRASFGPNGQTITIRNAHKLSDQAQNALLKTLEEPPNGAQIILETPDEDLLLPTILSRCKLEYRPRVPHVQHTQLPVFTNLPDRLDFAKQHATKRDEAESFVDDLLVASNSDINPQHIRALFKAKTYLHSNCNVRLVMENLFLNW